mmetsp:Transcript_20380/g.18049  ORF Transcript_20380/g.18049 Transcript_20380/m.18049 type:complete len:101 (+) Transcript_20380:12-314(+)
MYFIFEEANILLFKIIIFSTLIYPIVGMFNAKIFLDILKMTLKNQELLGTIENILQFLPDGVLIYEIGKDKNVQFINSAMKKLIQSRYLKGKNLNSIKLS